MSSVGEPIPVGGYAHHRHLGEGVSAGIAPLYSLNLAHLITDLKELPQVLAGFDSLKADERPRAWIVAPGHTSEQIAALKKAVGVAVFVVPDGTPERIGQSNLPFFITGMLDGFFRQPAAAGQLSSRVFA